MKIKHLLIVGGGSAGWMAAAYLNAALNHGEHRTVEIGLVESPDVPRIGVGEATIPHINHILDVIGIGRHEFLRRVDGTFKQAIKYVNWLERDNGYYYHPFSRFNKVPLDRSSQRWLMSDRSIPYMETVSIQPILCELGLAPELLGPRDVGSPLTYAYHMNALKFADYLCELATARGVRHYLDTVTTVEMSENGDIAAVGTKSGLRLAADLFIDCSGFNALLIEKHLGVPWVDCSQWLLCDRAVTMAVPYERHYPGAVRPYTTATALSGGWVWEIPLQDKRSLGYVHSSAFISREDAEREIRAFEGAHATALDTRFVHFKVGYRQRSWVRNCVAIGLAGNFIEPLESTGLYLSDLAAVILAEHFPCGGDTHVAAFRFNRILANRFHEILDFINLHYCLGRRDDSAFWREVRRPERVCERLRAKLDYWRVKPPSAADFRDQYFPGQPMAPLPGHAEDGDFRPPIDTGSLFGLHSYEAILYGMQFLTEECDHWYGARRSRPGIYREVLDSLSVAARTLPPHHLWLQQELGMQQYGGAPTPTGR